MDQNTAESSAGRGACYKLYVRVGVEYSDEGMMKPLYVIMPSGVRYEISRVKGHQRAASRKAGGCGIRYTVVINGQDANLYYEDAAVARWFVETRTPVMQAD